jgi:long-chain acyl-CoA synthetase
MVKSGTSLLSKKFPAISLAEAHALLTRPGSPFELDERDIRGVRMRVWKNAPPTMREVFGLARAHGDKIFVVYGDERVSYEQFARAALAVAEALQRAGVKKGDRVAIVDHERLERIFEHLQNCPALERVFVSRAAEDVAHPQVTKLETVIGEVRDWHLLPDRPLPDVPLDPEDDATILYTSGTTGKPKGALGTHRNSTTAVLVRPFGQARTFLRRGEPVPAPDPNAPQKCSLLVVPLFHTTGCHAAMVPSLAAGVKLVFMRKWDPEVAMQLIERERVTNAGGVPTIAWQLLEHPAFGKYDLSSLESISYGGAPAAAELVARLKEKFPKVVPGTGWGMTEVSGGFTGHQAEDYELRPASCGPAFPIGEMKIVDANGAALPADGVGELMVKGPSVVRGYWRNPQATAETFIDGWLRTGDIARLDAEGFCYILDRAKDMLIRGGENIYCVEVENALHEHPGVIDAAVVGIPHRALGEEPAAIVVLKDGANVSEAELRAFVAERLAAFKVPVKIVFASDALPRNPTGKLMKRELKKFLADKMA